MLHLRRRSPKKTKQHALSYQGRIKPQKLITRKKLFDAIGDAPISILEPYGGLGALTALYRKYLNVTAHTILEQTPHATDLQARFPDCKVYQMNNESYPYEETSADLIDFDSYANPWGLIDTVFRKIHLTDSPRRYIAVTDGGFLDLKFHYTRMDARNAHIDDLHFTRPPYSMNFHTYILWAMQDRITKMAAKHYYKYTHIASHAEQHNAYLTGYIEYVKDAEREQ